MSRVGPRAGIIATIVRKDIREFSRDQLYIFLSVLGLVLFAAAYYLVPDTVEETLTLGIHQTGADELADQLQTGADTAQGLDVVQIDSAEHLEQVVAGDLGVYRTATGDVVLVGPGVAAAAPPGARRIQVPVGIELPEGFVTDTATGLRPTVRVHTDAAVPAEIQGAVTSLVREIAYGLAGNPLPVTQPEEGTVVLGPDRTGQQISLRDSLLPMLAFFVLMIETFALASLIANEVLHRTVTAVLVTPARVGDFLAAKTIYGTALTAGQALLLLAVLQALTPTAWAPLVVTVVLGSLMFTGVAMIAGAAGRDFMGTLFTTMVLVLPLLIPAFSVLFPGSAAAWVQALPSYPVIHTLMEVTAYGAGWADVAGELLVALLWVAVVYVVGLLVLRRKVRRL